MANLADFAQRPGRNHLGDGRAAHDERAGIQKGKVIAAGTRRCRFFAAPHDFADRHGLPCQQGFVRLKVIDFDNQGIRRNPVALCKNDQIAAHHVPACNPQARAITDYQRARACQIAQGFQNALGTGLLDHSDQHRKAGKDEQDHCFLQVADSEVNNTPADQQRQHRLAQYFEHDPQWRALLGERQFVGPLALQARGCLGRA